MHDVTMTSKITSVAVTVVVTIMVSVVIAASLGTQDDMPKTPDPQSTHAPSETPNTVNGTPGTLTEPQDSASQTMEPPTWQAPSEEFTTVDVGVMFPSADGSVRHNHDNGVAVRLGTADFNVYLGGDWRLLENESDLCRYAVQSDITS